LLLSRGRGRRPPGKFQRFADGAAQQVEHNAEDGDREQAGNEHTAPGLESQLAGRDLGYEPIEATVEQCRGCHEERGEPRSMLFELHLTETVADDAAESRLGEGGDDDPGRSDVEVETTVVEDVAEVEEGGDAETGGGAVDDTVRPLIEFVGQVDREADDDVD